MSRALAVRARSISTAATIENFSYVRTPDGEIRREIPLSDEVQELLHMQLQRLSEQLGREPEPDDQLFWDEPEHMEHEIAHGMRQAGIAPRFIYAFEQTGRLVSEENLDLISEADLAEWQAAVAEYDRLHEAR